MAKKNGEKSEPVMTKCPLNEQDLIKTHLCAARAATAEVRNSRRDEKIGQQGRRRQTDRQV